jgi:hypothetical protein
MDWDVYRIDLAVERGKLRAVKCGKFLDWVKIGELSKKEFTAKS